MYSIQTITAVAIAGFVIVLLFALTLSAEVNFAVDTPVNSYQSFSFLSATTSTATSTNIAGGGGYFNIAGAKTVNVYFSRGTDNVANAGSSRFQIQVTPDGTNWYYFSKWLEDASSTINTVPVTMNTTTFVLPAGTSSVAATMNLTNDSYLGIRCIANETTDGATTCSASARF